MSMKDLEREILAEAKTVFKNTKLKLKDIQEWTTGDIESHPGEVVALLPVLSVKVAIKIENDKR